MGPQNGTIGFDPQPYLVNGAVPMSSKWNDWDLQEAVGNIETFSGNLFSSFCWCETAGNDPYKPFLTPGFIPKSPEHQQVIDSFHRFLAGVQWFDLAGFGNEPEGDSLKLWRMDRAWFTCVLLGWIFRLYFL